MRGRLIAALACGMMWGQEKPRPTPTPKPKPVEKDEEATAQLIKVKRIYVDTLTGGASAIQMRDLLMTSLQATKLFVITEDEERADAILRGAAEDTVFEDSFNSSESVHANANSGSSRSTTKTGGSYGGQGVGKSESIHTSERKHEAMATVRLVNKDEDIIWSTTQESQGGKFRGAAADVADRITKKLLIDYERERKGNTKGQPPR
jgi:hypothetical protein